MQNVVALRNGIDLESHIHFLTQTVERLTKTIFQLENQIQLNLMTETIAIPDSNGHRLIKVNELIRCEASGNYCQLYLTEGRRICVSKTLKFVQALLPVQQFIRIHQSHLVNQYYVTHIAKGRQATVSLGEKQLPVSRSRVKQIDQKVLNNRVWSVHRNPTK